MEKKCTCCNRSKCPRSCRGPAVCNIKPDKSSSSVRSAVGEDKETQKFSEESWMDQSDPRSKQEIRDGTWVDPDQTQKLFKDELYAISVKQEPGGMSSMPMPDQREYDLFYDCCGSSTVSRIFPRSTASGQTICMGDIFKHMENPQKFRETLSKVMHLTELLLKSKIEMSSATSKCQFQPAEVLRKHNFDIPVVGIKPNCGHAINSVPSKNISSNKTKLDTEYNSRKPNILTEKSLDSKNSALQNAKSMKTYFEIPLDIKVTFKRNKIKGKAKLASAKNDKKIPLEFQNQIKSKKPKHSKPKFMDYLNTSSKQNSQLLSENFKSCWPSEISLTAANINTITEDYLAVAFHKNFENSQIQQKCQILHNEIVYLHQLTKHHGSNIFKTANHIIDSTFSGNDDSINKNSHVTTFSSQPVYDENLTNINQILNANIDSKKRDPRNVPSATKALDHANALENSLSKQHAIMEDQAIEHTCDCECICPPMEDKFAQKFSREVKKNLPKQYNYTDKPTIEHTCDCECICPPTEDKSNQSLIELKKTTVIPPKIPIKPPKRTYFLVYPQHKDIEICIRCRFEPSPIMDQEGQIICPGNCGCCLCPWKPRASKSIEDTLMHKKIKVCKCRQRGTFFNDFKNTTSDCSQISYFDVCPCREKAEAKYLAMFGSEMWNDTNNKLGRASIGRAVLLSEVREIHQERKSLIRYKNSVLYNERNEEELD